MALMVTQHPVRDYGAGRTNDDELHPLQKLAGLSNRNVPQLKSNTHIVSAQYGFGWIGPGDRVP